MPPLNTKTHTPTLYTGKLIHGAMSARANIDGRVYVNFAGFGYLALSDVPNVRRAILQALRRHVPLSKSVAASTGVLDLDFDLVEQASAQALATEASVYFASGYLTGAACLAAMEEQIDLIAIDGSAHYNLVDAAKLSGLPIHTFAHCDADALANILRREVNPGQRPLVLTDGAFAATGRIPPLSDYASTLAPYDGRLLIDEAHSFGVIGEHGRGAAEFCGVEPIATVGATLSKAYCAHGAIVGCSANTAIRLRTSHVIRGSSAGSPLLAAAAAASLTYVAEHPDIRANLSATAAYLRQQLGGLGFDVMDSAAPIVAFSYGSSTDMRYMQRRLFERDILIVHGTGYVGCGEEGILRCSVFRDHSHNDIDALIDAMRDI